MCKISDKLKFCSCDIDDIYDLEHYWIFYRYEKDKIMRIVGSMLPPMNILITTERYNNKSLLILVNDPSSFDVDLKPKSKDRLQLHFTIDSVQFLDYGFEYKDNKWVSKKYHPFGWEEKYAEDKGGKIISLENKFFV
jgi:hypothetical protein